MNLIKVILSIIVAFIALWIIVAFFSPATISIKESIIIENSASTVFNQVNDFSNWKNWSEWSRQDSNMVITYSSPAKGLNATMSWKSEKERNGSQKIIESIPFEKIRIQVNASDLGEDFSTWQFEELDEFETNVTWVFEDSPISFFYRPLSFSISNSIENQYEKGLENLKLFCENEQQQNKKINPSIITSDTIYYVGKHIICTFDEIGPQMGMAYGELINLFTKNSWTVVDMPFSINDEKEGDLYVFDAAFRTEKEHNAPKGYISGIIPGGETVTISHYGMYENLPASYKVIENWIQENGYIQRGNSYEVYVTDPGSEPDSSKWETQLFYPVKKKDNSAILN